MNLEFLHSYALDGLLSFWGRGQDSVSWSVDNQVAVVHKKGVNIFECHPTPGLQKRPPVLTAYPSQIDGPGRLFVPDTGSVPAEAAMGSRDKQQVFDLLRDPILRPNGYDGMLLPNYYFRAKWSLHPFYRGLHSESKCLLGLLTTNNHLVIYVRCNRRYSEKEEWSDPWEIVLDVSSAYNQLLLRGSWNEEQQLYPADILDEYKSRVYQLAIVDFLWMPDWKLETDHVTNNSDEMRAVFKSCLMTLHANGDACIWEIEASEMELPSYSINLACTINILSGGTESFATVAFLKVSQKSGLLIVGTVQGTVKGILLEKTNNGDKSTYKFHVDTPIPFWNDADMMKIDHFQLTKNEISSKHINEKRWILAAVKHPNILLATSLKVKEKSKDVEFDDVSVLRTAAGPIVGLSTTKEGALIASHESGSITVATWDDAEKALKATADGKIELFDPYQTKKLKTVILGAPVQKNVEKSKKRKKVFTEKRLIFQGLGVSPNKSLLCIARSVGVYHDHLKIRRPSHLVFYSLLPKDYMWSYVQKLYAENRYSLKAMSDVLVPLRFYLRSKDGHNIYKEVFEWACPMSEKTTEELRLFYWCLKVKPGISSTEWDVANAEIMFNPKATRRLFAIEKLLKYRLEAVVDRIMGRRCASLAKAVVKNQNQSVFSLSNELNKQSLRAIYTFLDSKNPKFPGMESPPRPTFDPPPTLPLCYWCKGPIEYPTEAVGHDSPLFQYNDVLDDDIRSPIDEEKVTGYKWNERRHPIKEFGTHVPELCVLSLVPIQFPYRRCFNCPVTCLIEPAFGQLPYCPLCNSFMFPIQLPMPDTEVRPEQCNEAENQAHASTIFIKSEPQDIHCGDGEGSHEVYPSDQPFLHYQGVTIMPAVHCDAVGMEWADQRISSDEDEVGVIEEVSSD